MGKNLKGKECGKGICQRKDGLYYARFVDKTGKRHEKYLPTLPEARNWIEESKYADAHEDVFVATDTTVDQWFDFWIENIVGDLAPNTLRNYRERYVHNIQPVMGKMMIANPQRKAAHKFRHGKLYLSPAQEAPQFLFCFFLPQIIPPFFGLFALPAGSAELLSGIHPGM